MRFARKLVLLALAAAATMALSASSAQALEIATEGTGVHCTVVTPGNAEPFSTTGTGSGGCLIKAHSVGTVELSRFGVMTECNNVFEGRSTELGEGFIYSASLTGCSPVNVTPCLSGGLFENWILHVNADTPAVGGTRANGAEARFCVVSFGATIRCHLLLDVTEDAPHIYEFSTGGAHRACENSASVSVRGHWEQEIDGPHPKVEIRG
jgi:hypothetical protein